MPKKKTDDRVFATKPFKHYRRTYSVIEVRWGIVVLLGLCGVTAWVVYKGQHPDPELFAAAPPQTRRAIEVDGQAAPPGSTGTTAKPRVDKRGPLPTNLTPSGYSERGLAVFGPDNVYEKINGREGYYKGFGFQKMWFITLVNDRDETVVIDIETYDQGKTENALAAFSGETPADVAPQVKSDGLLRFDRNAVFLTRGRYYVRAVAADETETIRVALEYVAKRFTQAVAGEALPWSYALFVGTLGANPGKVKFIEENAFSFGFAKGVYTASLEGDLEVFVMPQPDAAAAKAMAKKFIDGWLSYGDKRGALVEDRYLHQLAGAQAEGRFVIGLRGAPDASAAKGMLDRLKRGLASVPAQAAEADEAAGSGGVEEPEPEAKPDADKSAPVEEY